ncbi:helix-turn-helix transcriptional regulator [Tardiphaga sp. 538_B7_N1_4]|uniref:helix-turn-helix transcriptional regulator n=1 Tax=Tardiphaga sp. 538_B7_N1_4 TaxID=3240778 RepID=UPI003F1F62BA
MEANHPLKAYREAHTPKLSQAALGEKLGVTRQTILRWENGQRKIETHRLPTVCEKTGIPAKELRSDLVAEHEKLFGESV